MNTIYSLIDTIRTGHLKFPELVAATKEFGMNRAVVRKCHLENFFKLLLPAVENCKNEQIQKRDFQRFDRMLCSFTRTNSDLLSLEQIVKIEKALKRRFEALPLPLQPIILKGPNGKEAIVSKVSLDSEPLQNMLKGNFFESSAHEISFPKLSEASFDTVVEFFRKGVVAIAPTCFQEIMTFAHQHCLGQLFNIAFKQYMRHLVQPSTQDKNLQNSLKATISTIFLFFGARNDQPKQGDDIAGRFKVLNLAEAENAKAEQNYALEFIYNHFFKNSTLQSDFLSLLSFWAELLDDGFVIDQNRQEAKRLHQFIGKYCDEDELEYLDLMECYNKPLPSCMQIYQQETHEYDAQTPHQRMVQTAQRVNRVALTHFITINQDGAPEIHFGFTEQHNFPLNHPHAPPHE